MKFSHSKLKTILDCPMTYNLRYNLGITPIVKSPALDIGSAIHWGIENNTSNLEKYYEQESSRKNLYIKDDERALAEVVVKTYLDNEQSILSDLLKDLKVYDIFHEVKITTKLDSKIEKEGNEFLGIIDYLLYTSKGFIIIDFKTSSKLPDFNKYLPQLYTYCMLMQSEFPDIPIYKIAIVNFVKSSTKRKAVETIENYKRRLMMEYDNNDSLINVQAFNRELILNDKIENFKLNLSMECDLCLNLINFCNKNNCYYVNYSTINDYGGSEYKQLLLRNKDSYVMYNVNDKWIEDDKIVEIRNMREIDFDGIYDEFIICRYNQFIEINKDILEENKSLLEVKNNMLKLNFKFDDDMIEIYYMIYKLERKENEK